MKAELLKTRMLPTPRVTLLLALLAVGATALGVYLGTPGDPDDYLNFPMASAAVAVEVAAIVWGVWLATIEFSQGTLRRALTAEPRRPRLILDKLLVVAPLAAAASAAIGLAGFWLGALAADLRGVEFDHGTGGKLIAVLALTGLLVALVSFALGLLVESFSGGLVLSFAVLFVLDGTLGFVDAVKDYTFGAALTAISAGVDPSQTADIGPWTGAAVAIAWVVILVGLAVGRFVRTDFK